MGPLPPLSSIWTQVFPPSPAFTDADIPDDLQGKVYVVTGASSGMGKELVRVLHQRNATVYLACRSEHKAKQTITELKSAKSKGELIFLHLDLSNLASVKRAAEEFLTQSSKLHVLFNNAGVMPDPGQPVAKTAQGHELALGVNCIGHFLFTKLLMPTLEETAASGPASTVRVVWLSSLGLDMYAPESRGIDMQNLDYGTLKDQMERYATSKCGDWLLSVEFARRHRSVVSVAINPGNVVSDLINAQSFLLRLFSWLTFYPTVNGVYSQLFAGFSPELNVGGFDCTKQWGELDRPDIYLAAQQHTNILVIPFGRVASLRPDLPAATKSKGEGGTGNAQEFWEWAEEQVKDYT